MRAYTEKEIREMIESLKRKIAYEEQNHTPSDNLYELETSYRMMEYLLEELKDTNLRWTRVYNTIKADFTLPQITSGALGERSVHVFNKIVRVWEFSEVKNLKKDDIFIMYENGLRYLDQQGNTVFVAAKDAVFVDGVWQVARLY